MCWREKNSLLQSKFSVLKSVVENGKISIALHGVRMIQSKLSLIYIQGLLLVNSSLRGHKKEGIAQTKVNQHHLSSIQHKEHKDKFSSSPNQPG
jgi:hypothetical protein